MKQKFVSDLLVSEKDWCRGSFYRDSKGDPVSSQYPDIAACCIRGALQRVHGYGKITTGLVDWIYKHVGTLVEWNDSPERTFVDVRDLVLRMRPEEERLMAEHPNEIKHRS